MHVINSHQSYFGIICQFNKAPEWQKELMLKGELLTRCNTIEPHSVRQRLRLFWWEQATKRGLDTQQLQTWA